MISFPSQEMKSKLAVRHLFPPCLCFLVPIGWIWSFYAYNLQCTVISFPSSLFNILARLQSMTSLIEIVLWCGQRNILSFSPCMLPYLPNSSSHTDQKV